jgi:hypothetical protein
MTLDTTPAFGRRGIQQTFGLTARQLRYRRLLKQSVYTAQTE